MTEKLYYQDAYSRDFQARIIKTGSDEHGDYVLLDRTLFYPTGGGQPSDLGQIAGVEVVGVELVNGEIRHYLGEKRELHPDMPVHARIDWERRFDFMQQHAGQHILSAAFAELLQAETVGFHLGREHVTIDLAVPDLTWEEVEQVERLADRIVFENRQISARFVEPAELASLPLRKQPTVDENIRIVTIADFDYSPCGGIHPARTGEVGPILVLDWERYKGQVRVRFVCGQRTRKAVSEQRSILQQASSELKTSQQELTSQITRLLSEKTELGESLKAAREQLMQFEAQELLSRAEALRTIKLVSSSWENRPMPELQRLAKQIIERESSAVCLLFTSGANIQMVFARGQEVQADANQLLKSTLAQIGGKGGGNPNIAQGGGTDTLNVEELIQYAANLVRELP
ncbi:alanyl-tRNA editing protein [Brevibacillus sp. B_LB10_24]|uniref:alanyl-tRNA editing protein n=1 Tax=Brevibacillus sp. B_LB10_24 TaxID=3380645 RepID=UPI0038B72E31